MFLRNAVAILAFLNGPEILLSLSINDNNPSTSIKRVTGSGLPLSSTNIYVAPPQPGCAVNSTWASPLSSSINFDMGNTKGTG